MKRRKNRDRPDLAFLDQYMPNETKMSEDALENVQEHVKIFNDETFATNDPVNHPSHYTDGQIEVSSYIADKNFNFFRGNAIKYVSRAGKKDSSKEVEDLEKAVWYINREIERLRGATKPDPLAGIFVTVPDYATEGFLDLFEKNFYAVWHEGLDAQKLADNIVHTMLMPTTTLKKGK